MIESIRQKTSIEWFHIFTRLIYVWQKCVAWRFVGVLGHGLNGFFQLNVEDKKHYIAKLSLIDGIDPHMLFDRDFSEDTAHLPSLR